MQQAYDVMVIGGGVVGLSAALAMAKRGFTTGIIDNGSLAIAEDQPDLRVYAINQASQNLFNDLGVWNLMCAKRLSPYRHMHVWDEANGSSIHFDSRMVAANQLGTIIDESVIKNALLKRAKDFSNLSLFPQQDVIKVDTVPEGMTIESAQQHWHSRLLIIADGALSPTRQKLHIPMTSWPYHQKALIATVQTEKPHGQTAFQVFKPQGPLAFLPLANPHQCSIVWSTTPTQAEDLFKLPQDDFNQALTAAFEHRLGSVSLISQRCQFPLIMRHTQQYSGKNWLLMGDAAHTIHPLAGLGLNVGLADVSTWLTCLGQSPHLTSPRILAAYQRQRKHAVWQDIALMELLKTTFTNPLPPFKWLRGLGLDLCDRLTPLKRLFISFAAGN